MECSVAKRVVFAGPNVQCLRSACTISQGLGEVQLQGGEVGQKGQQIWRLQHKNMSTPAGTFSRLPLPLDCHVVSSCKTQDILAAAARESWRQEWTLIKTLVVLSGRSQGPLSPNDYH